MNADQRITADGVIAGLDSTLQVRAENVDVAQLDTLLLGDGRLAGRFTGDAEILGFDESAERHIQIHAVAGRLPQLQVRGADGNG